MYLQKTNPRCEAFFQCPKRAATQEDQVWYDSKPLGVNKLGGMMKDHPKLASLSKTITPIIVSGRLQSPCGQTRKFHRDTSWRSRDIAVKPASEITMPAIWVTKSELVRISFPVRWMECHRNLNTRVLLMLPRALFLPWIRFRLLFIHENNAADCQVSATSLKQPVF